MRVKRWVLPPILRPPDPPLSPLRAAAAPSLRARQPPSAPSTPQPSTSTAPPTIHPPSSPPAVQRIRNLLRTVPRPPAPAKPPPLRTRLQSDLEHELVLRRNACARIHGLIRTARLPPPRLCDRKGKGKARAFDNDDAAEQIPPWVERAVVHLVAQTMRLQLHLGHVASAKELDRAFFSRQPSAWARRALRLSRRGQTVAKKRQNALMLGPGLGLHRGADELAWMQSLAVALAAGANDFRALERFFAVFQAFKRDAGADAALSGRSHVLASLARRMGTLLRRAERASPGASQALRAKTVDGRMRLFIDKMRLAEEDEGEVVALALLDSSLERLDATDHLETTDPLYQKVEADIERLVASLGDVGEGLDCARTSSTSFARLAGPQALERRAHILYLAIRFLLIRARFCTPPHDHSCAAPATSPLAPATQLYFLLLALTPGVASSDTLAPTALPRLRTRQSSALFRLLPAHLAALTAAQHRRPHAHGAEPAAAHLARLTALLSSTSATLAALAPDTPASQRRFGLGTPFARELVLALGVAFDASRPPARASAVPTYGAVRAALAALLAARRLDAALPPTPNPLPAPKRACPVRLDDDKPLLRREDAARALVRAALLAPAEEQERAGHGHGSDEAAAVDADVGVDTDARARLEALLDWVAAWQRASPACHPSSSSSAEGGGGGGTRERKARAKVRRAVRHTIERAWGGEGGSEWRQGVMRRVDEWVDEGEREWGREVDGAREGETRSGRLRARGKRALWSGRRG